MLIVRAFLFTLLFPGTVVGLIPWLLLRINRQTELELDGYGVVGAALFLVGVGIYLWCTYDFLIKGLGTPAPYDPPKQLVRSGLYWWVRNPMYEGILLILAGEALLFHSLALLLYTVIIFIGFHLRVVWYEEPTLAREFGEGYQIYCRKVNRWVPHLEKETFNEHSS